MPPLTSDDTELSQVVDFFLRRNGFEDQAALTLRRAIDEVVDGMRTGRWSIDSLEKTEKTYIGTKVEILFKFDFEIPDGHTLDTRIQGAEVDIKCTVLGNWMIPREAVGQLCLLVRIDEHRSRFSIGVIRATETVLTRSRNRDGKRAINRAGKRSIHWLVENGALPVNLLATLPDDVRLRIFSHASGQERMDELFRLVQGRIIPRVAIETVARQKDPMKRMRDARQRLRAEGILVLGHQDDDPATARRYGLPVPKKGEAISVQMRR